MKKIMAIVVSVMVLVAFFGVASTEAFSIGGNKVVVKTGDKESSKQTDKKNESENTKKGKVPTLAEASKDPNFIQIQDNRSDYYLGDSVKWTSEDPLMVTVTMVEFIENDRMIYTNWQIHYKLWPGSTQRVVRVTYLRGESYSGGKLVSVTNRGEEDSCYATTSLGKLAAKLYKEKTGGSGYPLVF